MTALKPIENRRVRGASSERYPLNVISSHPESTEEATDPHHIFPRSQIKSDSWFVEIRTTEAEVGIVLPHVTGLTREEHRKVEEHEAWIKLEDGVYNWYDRDVNADRDESQWVRLGPLNPQPGAQGKTKSRKRLKGEARAKRRTISIRVPDSAEENGSEVYDSLLDQCRESLQKEMGWDDDVPAYHVLVAAMYYYLIQHETPPTRKQRLAAFKREADYLGFTVTKTVLP